MSLIKKVLTLLLLASVLVWSVPAHSQVVFDYNPPANSASTNDKRLDLNLELDGINADKVDFIDIDTSAEIAAILTNETGTGALVFGIAPTLVTPVLNGIPTGTGVAAPATASTLALRDANANLSTNNFLAGYTTTVTAAGTTTLTVSSTALQYFTGTTTQTVTMPVVSTLVLGQSWTIVNKSSGAVTVQSSGANSILVVAAGNTAIFSTILTTGTDANSWHATYISSGAGTGTVTSVTCGVGMTGGTITTTGTCDSVSASTTAAGISTFATSAETEAGTITNEAVTPAGVLAAISGKHTISVPAGAMISETTTGCASGTVESATSAIMYKTMDCDGATQEGVQFQVAMPKSSDEGTLTFRVDWTAASGTGDVLWLFSCAAYSNDDALATANFGTEISVTDTVLTALDLHQAPESGAVTPGGTWAEGDTLWCRVQRDADAVGDTLNAIDARIINVRALYTINAFTDD